MQWRLGSDDVIADASMRQSVDAALAAMKGLILASRSAEDYFDAEEKSAPLRLRFTKSDGPV